MSMRISTTRIAQNSGREIRVRHFARKFALKKCDASMCILTGFGQNSCCGSPGRHFPVNFHAKLFLWHVHAFRLCKLAENGVPGGVPDHFPHQFPHKRLWWHVHVHFDCAGSHKIRNLNRNLAQTEFVQRSCQVTSYVDFVQRYCPETSYRDLTSRSPTEIFCGFFYRKKFCQIFLQCSCR